MEGNAFVNISWENRELFAGCFEYVGESRIIKFPSNYISGEKSSRISGFDN